MKKYATVDISTKTKIVCDTESINMWILADKVYRLTDFQILRILYWAYEFRFEIRV